MLENPPSGSQGHGFSADENVVGLRPGVIGRQASVAVAQDASEGPALADPAFVQALLEASLSEERRAFVPVIARMHANRITDRQIADLYLPAVAQLLGQGWCDDSQNFSQVTIGVARLQQLLPQLGPEWRASAGQEADAPAILLLIGEHIDHSFGAKILAGQMRRRGLAVRLALGVRPDDVLALMAKAHFDAVMLSASVCDPVETLAQFVNAVRRATEPRARVPVVIGGAIATLDLDLCALTGADLVTQDLQTALQFCGLSVGQQWPAAYGHSGAEPQSRRA